MKPYSSDNCRPVFLVNETSGSSYNESRLAVVHRHVSKYSNKTKNANRLFFLKYECLQMAVSLTFICTNGRMSTCSFKEAL